MIVLEKDLYYTITILCQLQWMKKSSSVGFKFVRVCVWGSLITHLVAVGSVDLKQDSRLEDKYHIINLWLILLTWHIFVLFVIFMLGQNLNATLSISLTQYVSPLFQTVSTSTLCSLRSACRCISFDSLNAVNFFSPQCAPGNSTPLLVI